MGTKVHKNTISAKYRMHEIKDWDMTPWSN